jgi:hypothetical protein
MEGLWSTMYNFYGSALLLIILTLCDGEELSLSYFSIILGNQF